MSKPSIFSFAKQTFIAGLIWQTQPKDSSKNELKQLAAELECDLLVRRDEPSVQYGFASSSDHDHVKKGIYSAAAVISKSMEMEGFQGNALAALELPDGRFMIYAQRSHAILPLDGDLIGTEDEMFEVFSKHLTLMWDQIIAPDTWGEANATFRDFASFIPSKKDKIILHNWWRLHSVNENPKEVKYLIGGVIFALLCGGAFYAYNHFEQIRIAKEVRDKIALDAANKASIKSTSLVSQPHPWASIAAPEVFVKHCREALHKTPFSPSGWLMESFACTGGSAVAIYARQISTVSDLKRVYPEMAVSMDGEHATLGVALILPCCEPEEDVLPKAEASLRLISFSQALRMPSKPIEVPPPVAPPDPNSKVQPPAPDWTEFKWSYIAIGSPDDVIQGLGVPGVRIEKMSFMPLTGVWLMEGVVYAQNK